jgi:hypothetical protein
MYICSIDESTLLSSKTDTKPFYVGDIHHYHLSARPWQLTIDPSAKIAPKRYAAQSIIDDENKKRTQANMDGSPRLALVGG